MLRTLMATSDGWELTVLRLAAGIMILPHGLQKAFGLFGGAGLTGIMNYFVTVTHIPAWLGYVVILTELLGGTCLILGAFARVAAFFVFCQMVGAVITTHGKNGFFMNWAGQLPRGVEGFEFHILAIAVLVAVMVRGAGAASVDRALTKS